MNFKLIYVKSYKNIRFQISFNSTERIYNIERVNIYSVHKPRYKCNPLLIYTMCKYPKFKCITIIHCNLENLKECKIYIFYISMVQKYIMRKKST